MTVLIIGYPGSGKSAAAERMVTKMSCPGDRIYLATMIPCGDEGAARVQKHRKMREGKGFTTIEAPFDVLSAVEDIGDAGGKTVLLECLSNLTANMLFEKHMDAGTVTERVADDILKLVTKVKNLIIVSNHFEQSEDFDEETVMYAETMDALNDMLSARADKVINI